MKYLVFFSLLIFLLAYGEETSAQTKRPLELKAVILEKKFCIFELTDEGVGALRLKLRLTFTNVSDQPIILYRLSRNIVYTRVSKTIEDLQTKRFEQDSSSDVILSSENSEAINESSPSKSFVILQKGKSFKSEGEADVFVSYKNEKKPGAVPEGSHVLQIWVSTWESMRTKPEEVRERWKSKGLLWFYDLPSEPMPFSFDRPKRFENCN
jgi:hypothetical protein